LSLRELQIAFGAILLLVAASDHPHARLAVALGMVVIFYWWSTLSLTPVCERADLRSRIVGLFTFVMIRFGLLAAAIARIVFGLCQAVPYTLQVSHWSAAPSNWTIAGIIALALFGFYASRGSLSSERSATWLRARHQPRRRGSRRRRRLPRIFGPRMFRISAS
jgi:hypothetical protein